MGHPETIGSLTKNELAKDFPRLVPELISPVKKPCERNDTSQIEPECCIFNFVDTPKHVACDPGRGTTPPLLEGKTDDLGIGE